MLGQRELYRMARYAGARPHHVGGCTVGILVIAATMDPRIWPVAAGGFLLFVGIAPFLLAQEHFLVSFTVTTAGVVYPTGMLGSLVWLRNQGGTGITDGEAFRLVLVVLFIVWATDIAAYYVGRAFGTHSLAPAISPNKTWEGTLGGFAAALFVAAILKVAAVSGISWPHLVVLAVIGGGVGQLGDLLESQLKRSTDTEDSSHILPGHGGVLDRFDALTVAAPVMCLYLNYATGLL